MTDDNHLTPSGFDLSSSEHFESDGPECGRTHHIECIHTEEARDHSDGSEEPPQEPVERDGEIHCPVENCQWWVPSGMGYLYASHRLAHIDGRSPFEDHETLPTELFVEAVNHRDGRDEYRGPAEIETFGALTDESAPGEVTVDIWNFDRTEDSDTEDVDEAGRADISLRLTHDAARELGKRLLAGADRAQRIAEKGDISETE